MKKSTLMALMAGVLLTLAACQPSLPPQQKYVVEGEVSDSSANGKTIYLMRYDDQAHIDSTVISHNHFTFKGQIDTAVFCRIDVTRREFANLILEGGHIRVNLQNYNAPEGTPLNEAYARLNQQEDSLLQEMTEAAQECRERYKSPDEFAVRWAALRKERGWDDHSKAEAFFRQHNNDVLGYTFLYTNAFQSIPMTEQKALLLSSGPWLKSRRLVQTLLAEIEAQENTAEGKPYADIKGKDINGNDLSLSDFIGKGNYVLLNMWASWCGPCKEEIPNLAILHNRYKDKGLTVVGLFTWDRKENLLKAIEKEKITWSQIIDAEQQATKTYGVSGIPHIILFSPDGTILKRDLRGQNMIKTIENILKNKQ